MSQTVIRGAQIKDSTVQRHDLDTSTVGQAVVTKLVQGSGVTLSSTGADSGTGDVTVSTSAIPLASSSTSGLMNQTSGNTTDFIDGTNASQPLQPVIWSVRLRSYQMLGNNAFEVDQRNAGVSTSFSGSSFGVDRWQTQKVGMTGAASAIQTAGTINLPGTNFAITGKFLRITLTTQQASLAAGDALYLSQQVEGPRLRELISDVHSVQILARSSVANFTFGFSVRDSTAVRSLTKLCTLPATPNTWALITLPNLPLWSAGGVWPLTPGVFGCFWSICLGAGATYQSPANDTFQTGNFLAATGQMNFAAQAVNSTFDLAFVSDEPGSLCSNPPLDCPFQQAYDDALRYFQKTYAYGVTPGTVTTNGMKTPIATAGGTNAFGTFNFLKPMAKIPTVTFYNHATGAANSVQDGLGTNHASTTAQSSGDSGFAWLSFATAIGASPVQVYCHYIADTGW